jgi:hypothetical protein
MRADGVEGPPPAHRDDPRFGEAVAGLAIEELFAHAGVGASDEPPRRDAALRPATA